MDFSQLPQTKRKCEIFKTDIRKSRLREVLREYRQPLEESLNQEKITAGEILEYFHLLKGNIEEGKTEQETNQYFLFCIQIFVSTASEENVVELIEREGSFLSFFLDYLQMLITAAAKTENNQRNILLANSVVKIFYGAINFSDEVSDFQFIGRFLLAANAGINLKNLALVKEILISFCYLLDYNEDLIELFLEQNVLRTVKAVLSDVYQTNFPGFLKILNQYTHFITLLFQIMIIQNYFDG